MLRHLVEFLGRLAGRRIRGSVAGRPINIFLFLFIIVISNGCGRLIHVRLALEPWEGRAFLSEERTQATCMLWLCRVGGWAARVKQAMWGGPRQEPGDRPASIVVGSHQIGRCN